MTKRCILCGGFYVQARGLCKQCYTNANKRIRARTTTWAALEAQGKAKAPVRRGSTLGLFRRTP